MSEDRSLDPQQWLDEYGDTLFQYALLHVREREQAEDIVQETFLAALRSKDNFRAQSSVKTWLIAILRNKIFDQLRKQYRDAAVTHTEDEEEFESLVFGQSTHWQDKPQAWRHPRQALLEQEFRMVYRTCVGGLPAKLADAFTLRTVDELPTEEICKILNLSKTNLGVILYRARLRLRKCLELKWFSIPGRGKRK